MANRQYQADMDSQFRSATPDPVEGRKHMDIQTDTYLVLTFSKSFDKFEIYIFITH